MVEAIALLSLVASPIPVDQMRVLVADRLSRLDKLVLDVQVTTYTVPLSASPQDRNAWRLADLLGGALQRVTIVRPNVKVDYLTDAPERGHNLGAASLLDGVLTIQRLTPNARGETTYSVLEHGTVDAPYFNSVPILQPFDIEIHETRISHLNLLRLFDDYSVTLVAGENGRSTYQASVAFDLYTHNYEFDLNDRGTPMRFKTTFSFHEGPPDITRETFTLATAEIDGVELITEAASVIENPVTGLDYRGVYHIRVGSFRKDTALTTDDVRINPVRRNSEIFVKRSDGTKEYSRYDGTGGVIESRLVRADAPSGTRLNGGDWRKAIPPICAVIGLATGAGLAFISRRNRKTSD